MGFFFVEKKEAPKPSTKHKTSTAEKKVSVETLHTSRCTACTLNKADIIHPKLKPQGGKRADLYVLTEAPTAEEDYSGRWLEGGIAEDIKEYIDEKVKARYFGIVRCHPEEKDVPSRTELECCRKFIEEDIAKHKPKVIVGLGHGVFSWLFDESNTIEVWRGRKFPVTIGGHKCWFVCTYSPHYIENTKRNDIKQDQVRFLERDVDLALTLLAHKPPVIFDKRKAFDGVNFVLGNGEKDYATVKRWLQSLLKEPVIAYDLETSAKKVNKNFDASVFMPFAPEARILTMAFGTESNPYAFPFDHPKGWSSEYKRKIKALVRNFLLKYKGIIVAHHLPFDLLWTRHEFDADVVKSVHWEDTMAQAFVLDGRKGAHSLDVLCRINFGFNLKALTKDLDKSNLINEPIERVLVYNGGDIKFTHKLYHAQRKQLAVRSNKSLSWPFKHLCRSTKTIVEMEKLGLPVNINTLDTFEKDLTKAAKDVAARIAATKEAKRFKKVTGRTINVDSDNDLVHLFTKIVKRKEINVTGKDGSVKVSTDKNVLDKIKLPIAGLILEHRDIAKQLGTYIIGTRQLIYPDGLLHPNINLMLTRTGRLSYDNPNGQNYPKRKNKHIRNIIAAEDGQLILAADYGQIEARVIGMASEDKAFCEALWNDYDVHMQWAERFCEMDSTLLERFAEVEGLDDQPVEKVMKAYRNKAKNGWVFPMFFGASFNSAAKAMMVSEAEASILYDEFWDTFSGVKKWQERLIKRYYERGYVETLTGRRRYGPLTKNEIINTPIQGTASDIVTTAANELYDVGLCPRLNVHDDLSSTCPKEGWKKRARKIASVMCKPQFDFIIVPLVVEVEYAQAWGELKPYREFNSSKDFGYH